MPFCEYKSCYLKSLMYNSKLSFQNKNAVKINVMPD